MRGFPRPAPPRVPSLHLPHHFLFSHWSLPAPVPPGLLPEALPGPLMGMVPCSRRWCLPKTGRTRVRFPALPRSNTEPSVFSLISPFFVYLYRPRRATLSGRYLKPPARCSMGPALPTPPTTPGQFQPAGTRPTLGLPHPFPALGSRGENPQGAHEGGGLKLLKRNYSSPSPELYPPPGKGRPTLPLPEGVPSPRVGVRGTRNSHRL